MPADVTLERKLPHSLEVECSVLGAILLDNAALRPALEVLRPADFFIRSHRRIFAHMTKLSEENRAIDLVTLDEELDRAGELEAAGGTAYLSSLVDGVPRVSNVAHYARIVKEKALLRKLIYISDDAMTQAFKADRAAELIVRQATEAISKLKEDPQSPSRGGIIRTWEDIPIAASLPVEPVLWLVERMIPCGTVTLLAGESGCYKTWLGLLLAKAVATGSTFLSHQCACTDVLYLDRENPAAMLRERIELLGMAELENLKLWGGWLEARPPPIGDTRLVEIARERKPLIILDSFIRFHNADENSATEMARVMADLRALANAGANVVVQHHKPKTEGSSYRGSTDILAGVDVAFAVSLDRQAGIVQLTCFKNRFGQEFSLALRPDMDESGDFIVTEAPAIARAREEEARLVEIIRSEPGLTQSELVSRSGLPQKRTLSILRQNEGKLWRTDPGKHNARCYYPLPESVEMTL